jgi:hypothetical protein
MAGDNLKRLWICFDLGLRGRYEELYAWLDKHQATECGDNIATFRTDKSRGEITKELAKIIDPKRGGRVYIIFLGVGGRFVIGRRKVAPWTGYGKSSIDSDLET